jgi:hypothetical protein
MTQTTHKLVPTTRPNYSSGSGLMLEVKRDGEQNWSKLKSAEPYSHNREVSVANQIKALEKWRDEWVSNGRREYRTAQYRIGEYKYVPELGGHAWVPAEQLLET